MRGCEWEWGWDLGLGVGVCGSVCLWVVSVCMGCQCVCGLWEGVSVRWGVSVWGGVREGVSVSGGGVWEGVSVGVGCGTVCGCCVGGV